MRLSDAVRERHEEHMRLFGRRWAAEDAERERVAGILAAHPEIGVLNSADGSARYYVWPAGGAYREAKDPASLISAAVSS